MRFVYSILLVFALGSLMLGCGKTETEPPPGVETDVTDLAIDTGEVVPASEIQDQAEDQTGKKAEANSADQTDDEK